MTSALRHIQQSRATVLDAYQETGDISILQEFAFLAECAGYKFVSESMYGRIKRIHAATFRDFVAAIRPVATPAEREAVAV